MPGSSSASIRSSGGCIKPAAVFLSARPDLDRASALRRRYSQTRSRSSVSFEEPVVKQPISLSTPVLARSIPSSSSATGSSTELYAVSSVACNSSIDSQQSASGHKMTPMPSKPATRFNSNASVVTQSTAELVSQRQTARLPILSSQREARDRKSPNLNSDCTLCYCVIYRRPIPFSAVVSSNSSKYSQWLPSKVSTVANAVVDKSVPMSCYRFQRRSTYAVYANSSIDTRSIFTHSSYWQYKNKMRVMQSMPTQSTSSSLVPATVVSITISTTVASTTATSTTTTCSTATSTIAASTTTSTTATSATATSDTATSATTASNNVVTAVSATNNTRTNNAGRSAVPRSDEPSFDSELAKPDLLAVTQVPIFNTSTKGDELVSSAGEISRPSVIASKKKFLHRSQSTPNAGEETQSKVRTIYL